VTKDDAKVRDYFTKAQEIKADDKDINDYLNPAAAAPKK
jgi:hypothetical protein